MLNTPPHLEARGPRGFVSIFHGTSSSVARRRLRASDLSFRQSMPSFDIGRPGLQMQPGASAVLGGVGEPPGSRCTDFNPRAPCGARLYRETLYRKRTGISIHAPRVGRDGAKMMPQPPKGISIHAPRVGRDQTIKPAQTLASISIHAPRVGRDDNGLMFPGDPSDFNPRAPCGARLWRSQTRAYCLTNFNPRAPCGARQVCATIMLHDPDFNPRAPCGARLIARHFAGLLHAISIHAPRVGRDYSRREVTICIIISIHAPRVGRDGFYCSGGDGGSYFNPRAPCGARLRDAQGSRKKLYFNPRAPCGARLHPLRM